jgi:NTP pyrophosphatase (non-canonical NTP hydrolase)
MPNLRESPTLKDYQIYIEELCKEKGFDKNSDVEKMLYLTEEVGELAKAIRKKNKLFIEGSDDQWNLEEELVDVFNYLLDIANHHNVDFEQAFRKKNAINEVRKWEYKK